jgi:hypothetical protein
MTDKDPGNDLAIRDATKPPIPLAPGTLDEAWRWAQQAAKSTLVPKDYREKPYDILTAIQLGIEVGFHPMTALQSIAVINGRPGIYGDALLALVRTSPYYLNHAEYYEVERLREIVPAAVTGDEADVERSMVRVETLTADDLARPTTRAVCCVWRKGDPEPIARTFSIEQATRARLIGKAGPWTEYPDRMLRMRARAFALRDAFPDVLKGLRPVEELQDIPPDAPPPIPVVRRRSEEASE